MSLSRVYDSCGSNALGKRLVIGIPTIGCRWWRCARGCVHCSVASVVALHKPLSSPAELVRAELARWRDITFQEVCVYTPGSITDDSEVSSMELAEIIEIVREEASPERLIIESRPELIRGEMLADLRRRSGKMIIEVSIPLESANPKTRGLIGKDFTNDMFVAAARDVNQAGCAFSTTVLLKPPGLSEGESIRDAWESLIWLRPLGPCRVVIEPMFVYDNTPLAVQYRQGLYKPPWLWSVLALIELSGEMDVEAGGEFVYPIPIARPNNCDICSAAVEEFLRRKSKGLICAKRPKCKCEKEWMIEIRPYLKFLPNSIYT